MKTSGHVVLVTGGGSGIGLAIAKELAGRGNEVLIVGRNAAKLERARQGAPTLHTLASDVTDPGDQQSLLDHVTKNFGRLTVLINNAGIMGGYDLAADPTVGPRIEEEVDIDLLAPLRLTTLALPLLLAQPTAAVVNMSSILAYAGAPTTPVYSATKAALHSFSRSLRIRLQGTSVRIFEVLPPYVDTGLTDGLNVAKVTPELVAHELIDGLSNDRYEIRVGKTKALYMLSRISLRRAEKAVVHATTPAPTPVGQTAR